MKRCWQAAVLILTLFAIGAVGSPAKEVKGPRIVVKDPIFDFKEIKEGQELEHTFRVLNKGTETLQIIKVKPG